MATDYPLYASPIAITIAGDDAASRAITIGQQVTNADTLNIDLPAANYSLGGTQLYIAGPVLRHEVGGLEADVSAFGGLIKISGGATSAVTLGTGVETALGINVGSAGAFVVNGGALGTPSSGDLSNCTNYPSANPTTSVGLSAVNGTAQTFMRSDAAPALSQSITPTWSGLHTFQASTLGIHDTGADHVLLVNCGTNLTANRTLTITPGDQATELHFATSSSQSGSVVLYDGAGIIRAASRLSVTNGTGSIAWDGANNARIRADRNANTNTGGFYIDTNGSQKVSMELGSGGDNFTIQGPSGGNMMLAAGSGGNTSFSPGVGGSMDFTSTNSTTSTVIPTYLRGISSGTPAAGFGVSWRYQLESSTTDNTDAGSIQVLWQTATHASRVADMVFNIFGSAGTAVEGARLRVNNTGPVAQWGFFGVAPVSRPSGYTVTNHTADKVYDANSTSVDELADILGSLLSDLNLLGLVSASVS